MALTTARSTLTARHETTRWHACTEQGCTEELDDEGATGTRVFGACPIHGRVRGVQTQATSVRTPYNFARPA